MFLRKGTLMKIALLAGAAALLAACSVGTGAFAQARDTIQIAGSSTVLPFSSIVAEEFGAVFPEFNTPVVGSGGTGGGFRQFCQGTGDNTVDIANASRPINAGETEACAAAGVTPIQVQFGFDGIVFASSASGGDFALTPAFVYQAIAAQVPVDGVLVDNPYTNWQEIDASLPNQAIAFAIPGTNHGTREVFDLNVVDAGCKAVGLPEGTEADVCHTLRQDVVVEIAGDYTETLARLQSNPETVGVFGLSFYDQNRDTLKVATVNGVVPSNDTVAAGEYPVSRPLFFYVKKEHIGVVPGLVEFTEYFLSEAVSGQGGILEAAGLIPQPVETTAAEVAAFQAAQ